MAAQLDITALAHLLEAEVLADHGHLVNWLSLDGRNRVESNTAFIAIVGAMDGHNFIWQAVENGARILIVSKDVDVPEGCSAVKVKNTFTALYTLASWKRDQFQGTVVAVTGGAGKTTVKEWTSQLLSSEFKVYRTPKNYNSRYGVPLTLWSIDLDADVAVIECAISEPSGAAPLSRLVRPDWLVITNVMEFHQENFANTDERIKAFLSLSIEAPLVGQSREVGPLPGTWGWTVDSPIQVTSLSKAQDENRLTIKGEGLDVDVELTIQDEPHYQNLVNSIILAAKLGAHVDSRSVFRLADLVSRMERVPAKGKGFIINDTYRAELSGVELTIQRLLRTSGDLPSCLVFHDSELQSELALHQLHRLKSEYGLDEVVYITSAPVSSEEVTILPDDPTLGMDPCWTGKAILLKGKMSAGLRSIYTENVERTMRTRLEIKRSALQNNYQLFKNLLPEDTRTMAMVKAFSYGGGVEVVKELARYGVDSFGVATTDEGVQLRENGLQHPILVMNAPVESALRLSQHGLMASAFSYDYLDSLIRELVVHQIKGLPVHLKLDTGMHRLGIAPGELAAVLELCQAQPEVNVVGIFSHLSSADDAASDEFTKEQLLLFDERAAMAERRLGKKLIKHVLNSHGAARFPQSSYDMVRLGIGVYGWLKGVKGVENVLSFKSHVAQIKHVVKGDRVGYGDTIVDKDMTIAVLPVGYADGYSRGLSNGKGQVWVRGQRCPVVGRVCMDMCMIDISHAEVSLGDEVELFGEHILPEELAGILDTIPYEIFTSIGRRVQRVLVTE